MNKEKFNKIVKMATESKVVVRAKPIILGTLITFHQVKTGKYKFEIL